MIAADVRVWTLGPDVRAELPGILAGEIGADPAAIRLARTPAGKPYLDHPDARGLRFSVSHSGELGVVAVTHGREVGVDVQRTRPVARAALIAERRFTGAEAAELRRLEGAQRLALFHRLWVRKEAYLKATGAGVAGGLDSFDALALDPPETGWTFADLDVPDGYAGALALAPPR